LVMDNWAVGKAFNTTSLRRFSEKGLQGIEPEKRKKERQEGGEQDGRRERKWQSGRKHEGRRKEGGGREGSRNTSRKMGGKRRRKEGGTRGGKRDKRREEGDGPYLNCLNLGRHGVQGRTSVRLDLVIGHRQIFVNSDDRGGAQGEGDEVKEGVPVPVLEEDGEAYDGGEVGVARGRGQGEGLVPST
jgi:hypothetical protein